MLIEKIRKIWCFVHKKFEIWFSLTEVNLRYAAFIGNRATTLSTGYSYTTNGVSEPLCHYITQLNFKFKKSDFNNIKDDTSCMQISE